MTQTDAPPGTGPGGAPPRKWFPRDLADVTGLTPKTIHRYNSAAKANRVHHQTRPGDLPKPDGYERSSPHGPPAPYWLDRTIRPWLEARSTATDGTSRRGRPRGPSPQPAT